MNVGTIKDDLQILKTKLGPTIKEQYWTESNDIWGVSDQTDTSTTTSVAQSGQTYQRFGDLISVFGQNGNSCQYFNPSTTAFHNAKYSFQYTSLTTKTVSFTGKFNQRGSVYIDGIKIFGSTQNWETFTHSYVMTAGVHDVEIITWDSNNNCKGQAYEIDSQPFGSLIYTNIDLKQYQWGRSCFTRSCEFVNAVSQSSDSQDHLYMVTTTNLNLGSDYWIDDGTASTSPIGPTFNQFIAIQQTFSEAIDYNFLYDGFCGEIKSSYRTQQTGMVDAVLLQSQEFEGKLIKQTGSSDTWLVLDNKRRKITGALVIAKVFIASPVATTKDGWLIPGGDNIGDGTRLIQLPGDPKIYFEIDNTKRHVTSRNIMTNYQFDWGKIDSISQAEYDALTVGVGIYESVPVVSTSSSQVPEVQIVYTLSQCRNKCINEGTCEYYFFQSSNGECYTGSVYCTSPEGSSSFKYYKLNQWSKDLWNSITFLNLNQNTFFPNTKLSPITFCDTMIPSASKEDLSAGIHYAPLIESVSVQLPFSFGCSTPIKYVLVKDKDSSITSQNVQIPWTSEELIETAGSLTINNVPQSSNQVQIFAAAVFYGYPGSRILDQHNITGWEIHISQNKLNCTYDLKVTLVENAEFDNKNLEFTEEQNSSTFSNLTFPLPFKFDDSESTCMHNITYSLSKTKNSFTQVQDNLNNVTNQSLTAYPGQLSVQIPSQNSDRFQFAFYVEITYTQGIYAPYKLVTNYQFTYNVIAKQPLFIHICPDDLKIPEWELKNQTQIDFDIITDENGDFDDPVPIFIWKSPAITQTNSSDPASLKSFLVIKEGQENNYGMKCVTNKDNSDQSFTITMIKECLLKNESRKEGEGLYRGQVAYQFRSTNYLCVSKLFYQINVKAKPKILDLPDLNFTFNVTENIYEKKVQNIRQKVEIKNETRSIIPDIHVAQDKDEVQDQSVEEEISKNQVNLNLVILREVIGWEPPIKPEYQNVTSYIHSISGLGKVQIIFNASMNPVELQYYNSDIIFIYLDKYDADLRIHRPEFLNMTWEVTEFKKFMMTIQLNFSSPLNISQESISDNLKVEIINNTYFYSSSVNNYLQTYSMKAPIRRQIPNTETNINIMSSAELGESTTTALFFISIVMTLIFQGSLKYYILMIRTLQLILHLQIFMIQAQGNVSMLYSILLPVANFDFQIDKFLKQMIPFNEGKKAEFYYKPMFQRFDLIGYGNNAITNMGSTFIVNMLQNLCFVTYLLIALMGGVGLRKEFIKIKNFLILYLFQIFVVTVEVFIQFMVSGLLNIKYSLKNPLGEVLGRAYAGECLILSLLLLPVYLLYTLLVSKKKFHSTKFKNRWGIIYNNEVKTNTNLQMSYFVFFVFRRIIYIFMALQLEISSLQLVLILYMNMQWFIYIGLVKPKIGLLFNRIEFLNEVINQVICFHNLFFTDMVPDPVMQFNIGWSQLSVLCFFMIINLTIIFNHGAHNLKLIFIKYSNRLLKKKPEQIAEITENEINKNLIKIQEYQTKQNEHHIQMKPQEAEKVQKVQKSEKVQQIQKIQKFKEAEKVQKSVVKYEKGIIIQTIEIPKPPNRPEVHVPFSISTKVENMKKQQQIKLKKKYVKIGPDHLGGFERVRLNMLKGKDGINFGKQYQTEKNEMLQRFNQYNQNQ